MSFRILVTAAGGALAPLNIKLLRESRRHDVWVAAVDARPDAMGKHFANAFAAVPEGTDPGYAEAIGALVKEHSIDMVLPWSDEEALALAKDREMVEAGGATLACVPYEMLQVMNDKAATFRMLEAGQVPVPDWTITTTVEELYAAVDSYTDKYGEFAAKPLTSRGNRDVYVIRTDIQGTQPYLSSRETHSDIDTFRTDHLANLSAHLPIMVMERLEAPAFDIDVLTWQGNLLRAAPRQRVNPAGVPFAGGILLDSTDLMSLAERVTKLTNLSWLYDYDVMTRRDGTPVIIELNPRPSGSIAAAILAGVPFYDDLISMFRSEALPEIDYPAGATILPYMDCTVLPAT